MRKKVVSNTREKLIDVTISMLWRNNYVATSVEKICRSAGIKKGSFYHHFTSKSELSVVSIRHLWDRLKEDLWMPVFSDKSLTSVEKFTKLLYKIYVQQRTCKREEGKTLGCPLGNIGLEMAVHDEDVRKTLTLIFKEQLELFEKELNSGTERKVIPPGDNRQKAIAVLSYIEGMNMLARIHNKPEFLKSATMLEVILLN